MVRRTTLADNLVRDQLLDRRYRPRGMPTWLTRDNVAKTTFAVTALTVLVGVIIEIDVAIDNDTSQFETASGRVFNMFCYFTIQSNLIVGITTALLALDLDRYRDNAVFRAFRLAGVVDIAITGIVYHVALADLHELDGKAEVANRLLHIVVPILAVAGWLVFGPRGQAARRDVLWAMVIPVAWLAFTLIRGPIVDFYPYPFLDVRTEGYARVLLNAGLVAVLFFTLAGAASWLDRRLRPASSG